MKKFATAGSNSLRIWPHGVATALAAAGVNLAILLFGRVAGVPFVKPAWDGSDTLVRITPGEVAIVSLVSVLVGIKLAKVVGGRKPSSLRLLQGLGALFAVTSLGGPLSLEVADATKALLSSMHLVCGGVYVAYLQAMTVSRVSRSPASTPAARDHSASLGAA